MRVFKTLIFRGISCIITVLLPNDADMETLYLFLVSKAMLSASFLIIYPFAGELYPTQVRGVGIGTSSYIGGLGLIVIPFITYLVKTFLDFLNYIHTIYTRLEMEVIYNNVSYRARTTCAYLSS